LLRIGVLLSERQRLQQKSYAPGPQTRDRRVTFTAALLRHRQNRRSWLRFSRVIFARWDNGENARKRRDIEGTHCWGNHSLRWQHAFRIPAGFFLFGSWIFVNLGLVPAVPQFDSNFVILAMAASVEALFLSTFILITQNRMSAAVEKRAELDLHISLLAEHEVTKLATLLAAIADRLGIETQDDAEVEEVKRDLAGSGNGQNRGD
jgi:Protein of unknown function (DUF1003)